MDRSSVDATEMVAGTRDRQTVAAGGVRATLPKIAGVQLLELGNVLTRSGALLELFRQDWPSIAIRVQQVNWSEAEIETALSCGARVLMLPFFRGPVARKRAHGRY